MFYQGDLQSGIALAVRETKSVVCFVRDDQDESTKWENEYFDGDILAENTVTLRLTAATQEASFLTSIFPIQSFPSVLVIRNGQIQEYIAAGTAKEDFQSRLRRVIVNNNTPVASSAPTVQHTTSRETAANEPVPATNAPSHTPNMQSQSSAPVEPPSQPQQRSIETAEHRTVEPVHNTPPHSIPKITEEKKSEKDEKDRRALQQKIQREKIEQKEERERIRNQIKKDQEARKQRAEEERNRAAAAAASETQDATARTKSSTTTTVAAATTRKPVSEYRLQIRLFDGSSVRNSFPLSATIRKDVRPWLDSQRSDGSQPYNLKHILTPLPNHNISVSEEERTLQDLDLGPTASLVMVPIPSYIEAYTSPTISDSLPGRAVSSAYGLATGIVGGAVGLVGSFLGYGGTSASTAETSSSGDSSQLRTDSTTARVAPSRSGGGINIRTLRDQRDEEGKDEFYNGNALNFEPNKNDDHKNN
ncbi:hypothetical protein BGW36DRAFT_92796 [Talaromyces proteolyticus]|uniref:UBX domain-containing protein n=1 Tax=Talaromyces proteolyticus TaxID=1131652 RepID=A0AAD4L421_9EURO|nr:uncharacterized protein BGW36DRAFT_92796 [Talaromyces proteolyticus]KAH8703828.1 hypothetical protein BGW36DRAFT_92796 [Talaromyces proteolyticus]